MSGVKSGILNVAEKFLDPVLNLGSLALLGISVPEVVAGVSIVGLVRATHEISAGIHAAQFEKGLAAMTFELGSVTEEEKINFFNTYGDKTVQEIGETVILLLNKIEMPLAANLIGRSHRLLISGEINLELFHNYCHVIKNLNKHVYDNFIEKFSDQNCKIFSGGVFTLMESLGLTLEVQGALYPSGKVDKENPNPNIRDYMKTNFGEDFYKRIIEPYV